MRFLSFPSLRIILAVLVAFATSAPHSFAENTQSETPPVPAQLMGNRFLTFNATIRVNQIEAAPDKHVGFDVRKLHTPARVRAYRAAVEKGFPGARITWALTWGALQEQSADYQEIRRLVVEYHRRHGDDVTLFLGGFFPNAYSSRDAVNKHISEGVAAVSKLVGGGYRPRSLIAGFLAAENQRYLAEVEKIHVVQGNIWSQFSIDNQDGDGSVCYPYYPSREHFCKPAQGASDFIDCVNLDGWTIDFLAGRRNGFSGGGARPLTRAKNGRFFYNSRLGVGPIETLGTYQVADALREMLFTTSLHFDTGFALNGFGWVANLWEMDLNAGPNPEKFEGMSAWFAAVKKRWPDTKFITIGEFGLLWRAHYKDNSFTYVFDEPAGTGIGGSDYNKSLRWFMTKEFRLALLGDTEKHPNAALAKTLAAGNAQNAAGSAEQIRAAAWRRPAAGEVVIDLTRYTLPAAEPQNKTRRWSLLGDINQKQTRKQDAPAEFSSLPADWRQQIEARLWICAQSL